MPEQPRDPATGHFLPSDRTQATEEPFREIGLTEGKGVLDGTAPESEVLQAAGLDPAAWELTHWSVREVKGASRTKWAAKKRALPLAQTLDPDELLSALDAWGTPAAPPRIPNGQDALVVALADWQIGGTGPGGGTRETISRVLAMGSALVNRAAELRQNGYAIPELLVLGMGDIVESCNGFYSNQLFSVDLDNRGQMRTAYHLVSALLRQWAPIFPKITVAPIGGNHGEVRGPSGKAETGTADNKDVLAFEIVRDILAERDGYGHVKFRIPDGELSDVIDIAGVTVGYTHGHLFSGGANAAARAEKWWRGQTFGLLPVRDAQILISGHFHHFSAVEFSEAGRTWFQCPAMDNGSAWFTDLTGSSSSPGTLSFRVGRNCGPRLWADLQIL